MELLNFLCVKKILARQKKDNISINVFCYDNRLVYPVYLSDQKLKICMELLLISDKNNSHYVYIKDFSRFMCNKTKCRNKKRFCRYCLQCFSSEKVLTEHKKVCLKINGKQTVKLKCGSIKFKNYHKQLAVSLKIYADLVCDLKKVKSSDKSSDRGDNTLKDIKIIFLAFLLIKFFVLMINLASQLFFTEEKNAIFKFIEAILKNWLFKKVIKKHFNKKLVMSAKVEERFQLSNDCWICDKLFDVEDDK